MTNLEKIKTLNAFELSQFIVDCSQTIFKRYTSSTLGFEKWLNESIDNSFWKIFENDMEYMEYLENDKNSR
jgi:hypothetical protein